MATNSTIVTLELNLGNSRGTPTDIGIILADLRPNPNLRNLECSDFALFDDLPLNEFLASGYAPRSFSIGEGEGFPASCTPMRSLHMASVEQLEILVTPERLNWCIGVVTQLHTSPRLARLHLELMEHGESAKSSTPLVHAICGLLEKGQLHTFALLTDQSNLDVTPVIETFRVNPSVTKFSLVMSQRNVNSESAHMIDVLRRHNVVLLDAKIVGILGSIRNDGMTYLTRLNRCGRVKARQYESTTKDLVPMFLTAKEYAEETTQLSLIYDLLLDSTNSWSSALASYHA